MPADQHHDETGNWREKNFAGLREGNSARVFVYIVKTSSWKLGHSNGPKGVDGNKNSRKKKMHGALGPCVLSPDVEHEYRGNEEQAHHQHWHGTPVRKGF